MFHFLFPHLKEGKCVTFKFLPMTQLTNCPSIHSLIPHAAYLNTPLHLWPHPVNHTHTSGCGFQNRMCCTLTHSVTRFFSDSAEYSILPYHVTLTISAYCVQYYNFPYAWNTQTHCIKMSSFRAHWAEYSIPQSNALILDFPHDKGTEVTSAAKLIYFLTLYLIRPPGVTTFCKIFKCINVCT